MSWWWYVRSVFSISSNVRIPKTHIKLNTRLFIEEGEGADSDFKFNLKLVLPKTKNRVHFSLTRKDGDDTGIDNTLADDAVKRYERKDRNDGVTASLRYFLKDTDTRNISLRTGVREGHDSLSA